MKNRKEKHLTSGGFTNFSLQKSLILLVTVMFLLATASVSAEEKSAGDTEFGFEVYAWMSTLRNTTATGDTVLINFGDILKNLDFTAMLRGTVQKDRFFGVADMLYMNIGTSQRHNGEFLDQPVTGKLEVGLEAWVLNFVGGYNLVDNGKDTFGLAAGARYLKITLDTTVKLEDQKRKESRGDNVWDGVVGLKGRHNFPDGHYFNYYADVGGGDSKLTWQALVNFAYDYKKFTGTIGYRYLKWNFKNDAPALDDLTVHGPYLGAKWTW